MKKYFLLATFILSFSFFSLTVFSALDYKCDSRPNSPFSLCSSECAPTCGLAPTKTLDCGQVTCPEGTLLVDCWPQPPIYSLTHYSCLNLDCGNAGVPSGNTCVQQSSLDSACVNSYKKDYGYTDNYGWSNILNPCGCYETTTSNIPYFYKRPEGAVCYKDGGTGTCKRGVCILPLTTTCTAPSSYSNSNNCESGGCKWCGPPAYSGYCEYPNKDCTSPCTYKNSPLQDDAACPDECEYNGCNLRINVCTTGGTCGYSGTSKCGG